MSAKKDEPTSTVSVRVSDGMKKVLEAIAHEERRTVSSLLGRLIENHVKNYEPKTIARALHAVELRHQEEEAAGEYGDPMEAIRKEVEKLEKSQHRAMLDQAAKKK
jgi:predicted transcriptional regulator